MDTAYFDFVPNETLEEVMSNMEPNVLNSFCNTYGRAREICNKDTFWKKKYGKDFPDEPLVKANSSREAYNERVASRMQLPWTILKAQQAQQATDKCIFIFVPTGYRRHITGMKRAWMINPTEIYHLGYRIVGQPTEVREALRKGGVSESTVKEIMETAFTSQNQNTEPFASMIKEETSR